MTPEEERAWAWLVKYPTADAAEVSLNADVTREVAQNCIDRIGTPYAVRAGKRAPRVQLLEEASRLTAEDRNRTYGDPYAQHLCAARIMHAMSGIDLRASDIVRVMMAVKLSRLSVSPAHKDSMVDLAAYTAILHECVLAETEEQHAK